MYMDIRLKVGLHPVKTRQDGLNQIGLHPVKTRQHPSPVLEDRRIRTSRVRTLVESNQ